SAVKLRQIVNVRARLDEGAARGKPLLEIDDAAEPGEPLRAFEDLPARQVAKACLENVEIERRVQVVAVGPRTIDVVDPGDDTALIIDIVVDGHGDSRRCDAWRVAA